MAALVALILAAGVAVVDVSVAVAADSTAKAADEAKQPAKPADPEASSDKKLGKKSKKACAVKGACSTEKGTLGKKPS
jgi:hypothetical protein